MAHRRSSLLLDLGLLGTAALIGSVTLSLALEPLVEGDPFFDAIPSERSPGPNDNASFDVHTRDRLAELTKLSPTTRIAATLHSTLPPLRFAVAATVTSLNSAHSSALLINPDTRIATVVRIGDLIDGAVVTAIEYRLVTVHRFGRDELLRPAQNLSPIAVAAVPFIRELSPDRLVVRRTVIDSAAVNVHALARQAFFAPSLEPAGFRIDRIQPGSLFEQLGLRNGDVLVSVDDIPTHRFGELAAHYSRLGRTAEVRLAFLRAGQLQRRTYAIDG